MRDINRIPILLKELEKVWLENPDFRLGQLITIATRPSIPHPTTFYIEDDKMLNGLKSIGKEESNQNSTIPYWKKYPDICRMNPEELSTEIVLDMLDTIKNDKRNVVITANKLMELTGAPVKDDNWMNGQKSRIHKLNAILKELKDQGVLEVVQVGYKYNKQSYSF